MGEEKNDITLDNCNMTLKRADKEPAPTIDIMEYDTIEDFRQEKKGR